MYKYHEKKNQDIQNFTKKNQHAASSRSKNSADIKFCEKNKFH